MLLYVLCVIVQSIEVCLVQVSLMLNCINLSTVSMYSLLNSVCVLFDTHAIVRVTCCGCGHCNGWIYHSRLRPGETLTKVRMNVVYKERGIFRLNGIGLFTV